ncbi:amidase [Burkholderia sp. Ac-20353]|uniref:amidase n=1 Tax=Burkholderia sp. Ac-20353 TaxID=2703894 RepID=UPI00197C4A6F|nr:amidase [Burkholderia sp. Ac-20353]MBN3787357.1 amidase [Burkholderia sp. Ac-20353]
MTDMYDHFGFDKNPRVVSPTGGGPLQGLRIAVKDVIDIAGHVSGAGNPDFARDARPAETHAGVVTRLLDSGSVIAGKTLCDELAFSLMGRNIHYGTPLNTQAPDRLPGGSSSGSAAVVAAGLVDAALGTDTSGSVRVPASYCGLFGMRPTWGGIDTSGIVPLARSFDTVGWFARDPEVLMRLGKVLLPLALQRTHVGNGRHRLLIARDAFDLLPPDIAASLTPAVEMVRSVFVDQAETRLAEEGLDAWADMYRVAQAREVWDAHGQWYLEAKPSIDPEIEARLQACQKIANQWSRHDESNLSAARRRIATSISNTTFLCVPSTPGIAPLRTARDEELVLERARILALTCIASLGGLPQVSLPLARHAGCPIGISLIGPRGSDLDLLALAACVHERIGAV